MKKKLTEVVEVLEDELYDHQISESDKLILRRMSFPFAIADKENSNGRTYPSALLKREVQRMNDKIKDSKIAGCVEHPVDGITKLGDVSHFIEELEFDENSKTARATASILGTQKGKDVLTLLQAGMRMGVSMRGFGTVGDDGEVQDDYALTSIDIVTGPACEDAKLSDMNLHESLNSKLEREKKNVSALYQESLMAGYTGNFQDWKKRYLKEDF